jgi:hypothetical protein
VTSLPDLLPQVLHFRPQDICQRCQILFGHVVDLPCDVAESLRLRENGPDAGLPAVDVLEPGQLDAIMGSSQKTENKAR